LKKPAQLDAAVATYYAQAPEEDRLKYGAAVLEEARTRELIQRHAPGPPAVVLDVGGGAGAYSFWLADLGYTVHLVDATPRLIAEAQRRAVGELLASSRVGDARALEFPDGHADVVLLLGPLYHLTTAADRAKALAEASRVLKPGGWLFGAVISRWASALDGLARDLLQDSRFAAIVQRDLQDGQHRNPTDRLDFFTTAYFHTPSDALMETAAAGFANPRIFAIEGPGWLFPDVQERMSDPRRRADLLLVAGMLESEPSLIGVSAHLLVVAQKS
jgi:SAM-dependent methyltransferase